MPELPEVHTTVTGLQKHTIGLFIKDVWTDYKSTDKRFINQIKNPKYFHWFKTNVSNSKIKSSSRRAKNILMELDNGFTILIHLKMTGHLLFGTYRKAISKSQFSISNQFSKTKNKKLNSRKEYWIPKTEDKNSPLWDPYNKYIHLVFTFSNGKNLVLCDARKFAKVQLFETKTLFESKDLKNLGPEPLSPTFSYDLFKEQIYKRKTKAIKTVLMDQEIIAGIGNIYSDEILWRAGVHPNSKVFLIPEKFLRLIYKNIKPLLEMGIDFRGDSMSDYRNIDGRPGEFQNKHETYKKTGKKCSKKRCGGIIERLIIGGRSSHFCPKHQKHYS